MLATPTNSALQPTETAAPSRWVLKVPAAERQTRWSATEASATMSTQGTRLSSLTFLNSRDAAALALAFVLISCASSHSRKVPLGIAAAPPARQQFLEMWARAYFPGRTGQLLVVPREGDFTTRTDPN